MKTGPEEVRTGSLFTFAHQAYWGFRYLRERKEPLWLAIKTAITVSEVQQIGEQCAAPNAMPGAGYGAVGMMTWLARDYVAREVLNAKKHSQYPISERPSSEDRRMIFLGVATAAGIFELTTGTALRKLAEANLGLEGISERVHQFDRYTEMLKKNSFIWAEPVGNYFWQAAHGEWILLDELPCEVPKDWQGGYFIYGYTDAGPQVSFVRSLPIELQGTPEPEVAAGTDVCPNSAPATTAPNHLTCECGATIAAGNPEDAAKALAEHIKIAHKVE